MKLYNHIFLTLICSVIYSCASKHEEIDSFISKIDISEMNSQVVSYSSVFKKLDYIKLETTPECLLPSIYQIELLNDKLFIHSSSKNTIYIFEKSGRFLSKIYNVGKGPKEMIAPTDFALSSSREEIFWLDNNLCKIFVFDYAGNFKASFNSLNRFCFTAFGENTFLFYNHLFRFNYKNFGDITTCNLVATNNECKIIREYCYDEYPEFLEYISMRSLHKTYSGEVYFLPNYGRTIYSFDSEMNLIPKYKINFKKDISLKEVEDLQNEYEFNNYVKNNKFPSIIDRLFINDNYIYFVFVYMNQSYHVFHNRLNDKSVHMATNRFIDDYNSIQIDAFFNSTKTGLLGMIPMHAVIESYRENIENDIPMQQKMQLSEIVESSSLYDNPVIVFANYK